MKKILSISLIVLVSLMLMFLSIYFLFPVRYSNFVEKYSQKFGVQERLVYTVINIESSYKSDSLSKAGAVGLMQILPSTAKDMANRLNLDFEKIDLYDEETNIMLGCYYISYLLKIYNGNVVNTLCAYNWGMTNVNSWIDGGNVDEGGTITKIPVTETKNYILKYKINNWVYRCIHKK